MSTLLVLFHGDMLNLIRVKFEHYVNTFGTMSWRHVKFDHYVNGYGHFCTMTLLLNLNNMSTLSLRHVKFDH